MSAGAAAQLWTAARTLVAASMFAAPVPAAALFGDSIEMVGAPAGFERLEESREVLVDVHFGGIRIGEARATSSPGFLEFQDPGAIVARLPDLTSRAQVASALSQALPTNTHLACSQTNSDACGTLSVSTVGIIFDEERFRVDLFVAPHLLATVKESGEAYLESPSADISLTSSSGLAISGSSGGSTTYNLQNRTIVGLGNARVRADSSVASKLGYVVDDLVLELDRPNLRYSAGLFWAPGVELVGNRRIVGVGIGSQFDTRLDREALQGTPLLLSLSRQSRVEVLADGRLLQSGLYEAGNTLLDTSSLPAGSYPILLRIHEPGGSVREERRFFIKSAQLPPLGEPLYSANLGMLAHTRRGRPISISDTLYYQVGAARRLSESLAADLQIVGTQNNAMVQAGGWLITPVARARVAGLYSAKGDRGLMLQLSTGGRGRLNATFDLRKMWNSSGRPLVPLNPQVDGFFGPAPPSAALHGGESYTQATGSVSYSLGRLSLIVAGSLRDDAGAEGDYSVGADLRWRLASLFNWQLVLNADAQLTRNTLSRFVGLQLFWRGGEVSVVSRSGHRNLSRRDGGGARGRGVWNAVGQYSRQLDDGTQLAIAAGVDRDLDTTTAHGSGTAFTRFGNIRADIAQQLEGGGGIQYGLSVQTAVAATPRAVGFAGRDLAQSAVIVSVDTAGDESEFDILIDGQSRGRLFGGRPTTIFLEPYRNYRLRLRPIGSTPLHYDLEAREITLYPGSVEEIRWRAEASFTVFGQAVLPGGSPLANAGVRSGRGIGQTDENGYFQIDVGREDDLTFSSRDISCAVELKDRSTTLDYIPIGKVLCQ